ncbi:hypothetical protein U717_08460 [Rhodobacter capsulatus R121]|nr:hypothetical protein U714_08290 [Rhodobacter capsulatus DE442]ETD77377.1 hypothetical protein U717_08460 [Rhodobacter capsulatus R121]ETE54077.1 hypothetical protein U715_08460 [Rhodobacter capsulatus Y262]
MLAQENLCEPQIAQLCRVTVDQNIGRLNISMNYWLRLSMKIIYR